MLFQLNKFKKMYIQISTKNFVGERLHSEKNNKIHKALTYETVFSIFSIIL